MKLNLTKEDVKSTLRGHPREWFTTQQVMAKMNLTGDSAMRRVSRCLYRLRNDSDVERCRNTAIYKYRFIGFKKVKSPTENLLKIVEKRKKAIDVGSDSYDGYTNVELVGVRDGYCEECSKWCEIAFRGEKNGLVVYLCQWHGREVDKFLFGNRGRFQ
jgi:hypothetical protein